ncbi:MFS transporter [uncultured Thiothrix sp.]|uniref:MFS transporter n=1 Tax=uncultured Thiothrix sp. TaxID=223185 RepID=UPI002638B67D|nr:MFS transporter [uncultured Thiothrix sp.]
MNPKIVILSLAQACYWFAVLVGISLSTVIGLQLAPSEKLATLPYALISVGALGATYLLSIVMQRSGRRLGFQVGALAGAVAAGLAMLALSTQSFVIFCAASLLMGIYQASSVYYRLAALDEMPAQQSGVAIGWVLSGSLLAAILGPSLAKFANHWIAEPKYLGAYGLVAVFSLLALLLISFLGKKPASQAANKATPASFLKRPAYWLGVGNTAFGQAVMMLMMLVAPLAMHQHHYSVDAGMSVIGWHIIGMFLPSFVSGKLVDKFGAGYVLLAGLAVLALSALASILGTTELHYHISLFLLGIGWNLMYVAGTNQYNQAYPAAEKGRAQGIAELVIAVAAIVGVMAGGLLIQSFSWQSLNLGLLVLLGLVVVLNLWMQKQVLQPTLKP